LYKYRNKLITTCFMRERERERERKREIEKKAREENERR
jgi:hypothetical protein